MNSGRVVAPFDDEQVAALNAYQGAGVFHPFTCGACRDTLRTRTIANDAQPLWRETAGEAVEVVSAGSSMLLGTPATLEELTERLVADDRLLTATTDGWRCATCSYRQDWAWAWMADRSRWEHLGAADILHRS